ncbi:MAG: hypothetical protein JJU00_00530 [Opitutales bacterium]|nr:hypothetical protein [Opitutales bacterium]
MEITAILHDCSWDGDTGYAATYVEFPEAIGQGETKAACLADLRAAVNEVLAYRREEAARTLAAGDSLQPMQA